MCKIGDIIVIDRYEDNHKILRKHSFIVIEDKGNVVEGLPYDMICNVLSSFKSQQQKKTQIIISRQLSYC